MKIYTKFAQFIAENKLVKFVAKHKNTISIVLLICIVVYFFVLNDKGLFEGFEVNITEQDVEKIDQAIMDIMECQSKKCNDGTKVRNFQEFKTKLNYPNFKVGLFMRIYNHKKKTNTKLTLEDIRKIATESNGKFAGSFDKKTTKEGFDETTDATTGGTNDTTTTDLLGSIDAETQALLEKPESELTPTERQKADCVRALNDIRVWMDEQKASEDAEFKKDTDEWNKKKADMINKLASDPTEWANFCATSPEVCNQSDGIYAAIPFFTHYDAEQKDYQRKTIQGTSEAECAIECIKNPNLCDFYSHRKSDGVCWLRKGAYNNSVHMGFKTKSGFRWSPYTQIKGKNISGQNKFTNLNPYECQNRCENNSDCHYVESKTGSPFNLVGTNRGDCYLKQFGDNPGQFHTGVLNKSATGLNIDDSNSWLVSKIGSKPNRSAAKYNRPIEFGPISCQVCQQEFQDVKTTDSSNVNFDQVMNCIANIKQEKTVTPPTSDTPPTSPTTPPTDTPPTDTTPPKDTPPKDDGDTGSNNNQTLIIIGVIIAILVVSSSLSAIYAFTRSRQQ